MNIIPVYLKKTGRMLLTATILCCALFACDNVIYDTEGDCSVSYRVAFRYDRNMKWADAFAHEVKSVHLYAFDKGGTLVWQQSERGEALSADGYAMTLDLPAGDYHLVAWCGLENDGEREESFSVPEAVLEKPVWRNYVARSNGGTMPRGRTVKKSSIHSFTVCVM